LHIHLFWIYEPKIQKIAEKLLFDGFETFVFPKSLDVLGKEVAIVIKKTNN